MDDIDTLFIEAKTIKATKPAHLRQLGKKTIRVKSSIEKAKDDFKRAKHIQRQNVLSAKNNIKSYRLLIKQARNTYKLVKLANK